MPAPRVLPQPPTQKILPLISSLGLALIAPTTVIAGTCVPSATTLCLDSNRFQVEVEWASGASDGDGEVFTFNSDDYGFFTLADGDVVEVKVEVLDGCAVNGNYWVFAASLSDFGQTLTVTDTVLGNQAQYTVTEGTYGSPVTDTGALPCSAPFAPPPAPAKGGGGTILELVDGRFLVEVEWEDFAMMTGDGFPVGLTDSSGYFGFLSPTMPDLLLKLVPDSGFFRFVSSATANLAYDITVTDVCSAEVHVYSTLLGTTSTIVDDDAFLETCAAAIFDDDFESGDVAAWSASVGGGLP